MNNIYVDMVGDLFHINHIKFLEEAKTYGTHLSVGVHSDKTVENYKCIPIMNMEERIEIIRECKYVDKVIPDAPSTITKEFLLLHNIDLVLHAHEVDEEKYNLMYKVPIDLNKFKRLEYRCGICTTELKNRVLNKNYKKP